MPAKSATIIGSLLTVGVIGASLLLLLRSSLADPAPPAPPALSEDGITPALEAERAKLDTAAISPGAAPASGGTNLLTEFDGGVRLPVTKLSDTHFALTLPERTEFMFYIRLTGVRGKTIRIDINNIYYATKWSTFNPVYRDAKDGSKILLKRADADADLAAVKTSPALNGAQLPDTTGLPWHFIPNVWTSGPKAVSFVQTFDQDDVYVAMKTPFDLTDYASFVDDLKGAPGVRVIDLGESPDHNPVRIIKVSSGDETEKTNPTLVFYAREFADENDASWVAAGALQRLLRTDAATQELRKHFTFLFIPVLDLDGAYKGIHQGAGFNFGPQNFYIGRTPAPATRPAGTPQPILYANFFRDWIRNGGRIDLVTSFHNVESKEEPQLTCPLIEPDGDLRTRMEALFAAVVDRATTAGFSTFRAAWQYRPMTALTTNRLSGWLTTYFGPLYIPLDANSQDKQRHLNATELKFMGGQILLAAARFLTQPEGESSLKAAATARQNYLDRWKKFGADITESNPFRAEQECLDRERNTAALEQYLQGGPVAGEVNGAVAPAPKPDAISDHFGARIAQIFSIPDKGVEIESLLRDVNEISDMATKGLALRKLTAALLAGPHPETLPDKYFALLDVTDSGRAAAREFDGAASTYAPGDLMWKLAQMAQARDLKQSIELARASVMLEAMADTDGNWTNLLRISSDADKSKKLLALSDSQFAQMQQIIQTREEQLGASQSPMRPIQVKIASARSWPTQITADDINVIIKVIDASFRQTVPQAYHRFEIIQNVWSFRGVLEAQKNDDGVAAVKKQLESWKHDFPDPNIERWINQALTHDPPPPPAPRVVTQPTIKPAPKPPAIPKELP